MGEASVCLLQKHPHDDFLPTKPGVGGEVDDEKPSTSDSSQASPPPGTLCTIGRRRALCCCLCCLRCRPPSDSSAAGLAVHAKGNCTLQTRWLQQHTTPAKVCRRTAFGACSKLAQVLRPRVAGRPSGAPGRTTRWSGWCSWRRQGPAMQYIALFGYALAFTVAQPWAEPASWKCFQRTKQPVFTGPGSLCLGPFPGICAALRCPARS